MGYGIKLRVWGDYACFTRPEFKVERVSYDIITPSAARGIIESIYWKPSIRWFIDKITVLNEINFGNIKLNETKRKAAVPKGDLSKINGEKFIMYTTLEDDNRSQRGMMFLKNVEYIIEAHFELTGIGEDSQTEDDEKKHYNMALRRIKDGQTYKQPYLGLRDFSANFEYVADDMVINSSLKGEKDLGYMLYDMAFKKPQEIKTLDKDKKETIKRIYSDSADPIFFRPIMNDGVIDIAACFKNSAIGGLIDADK